MNRAQRDQLRAYCLLIGLHEEPAGGTQELLWPNGASEEGMDFHHPHIGPWAPYISVLFREITRDEFHVSVASDYREWDTYSGTDDQQYQHTYISAWHAKQRIFKLMQLCLECYARHGYKVIAGEVKGDT